MTKLTIRGSDVNGEDIEIEADRASYVELKTKDLIEFGYPALTTEIVDEQLDLILDGTPKGELTIIGMFIFDDIVLEEAEGS